jgi:hypothetical protein
MWVWPEKMTGGHAVTAVTETGVWTSGQRSGGCEGGRNRENKEEVRERERKQEG